MTHHSFQGLRASLALSMVAALTACGGGGSSGADTALPAVPPATTAPVFSVTPQGVKTLHFRWTDGSDETGYRLLEDADGASGFTPVATLPADTTSHDLSVFLPDRVNARYVLQTCDAAGCVSSAPVDVAATLIHAIGYVKTSHAGVSGQFGHSLAVSADGETLAVGVPRDKNNATGVNSNHSNSAATASGAVHVFARSGSTWIQQAYVKASNTDASDRFGDTIALSADGNTLAVGAPGEASAATGIDGPQGDNTALASGAAYIFTRSGSTWNQQAYLKAFNAQAFDEFGGRAIALSSDGNTLAVSATGEDGSASGIDGDPHLNFYTDSGAVYVFARSGTTWAQQAYVKASDANPFDVFGNSLALSADGNTMAVGAPSENSSATGVDGDQHNNGAPGSGAAYLFTRSSGLWVQQAYVKPSNTHANDWFGFSLALSSDGHTLAVGAPREASAATGVNGQQLDNAAPQSGAVYVFARSGSAWSQQAYVKASNTDADDWFGARVAISGNGNTLAVAAPQEDSAATGIDGARHDNTAPNSGAVHVFQRNGGVWQQKAYVKASNTNPVDNFANDIALSADARLLAVGAIHEDSNATGIGGDQNNNAAPSAGAVYLY